MMISFKKGLLPLFILTCFYACSPRIEQVQPLSNGGLDLSNYVAIGNSLTSGFTNGGLYEEGQRNAFPNLISEQFAFVGGGDFSQPWALENGSGYVLLKGFEDSPCELVSPSPELNDISETEGWRENVYENGPFNNLGVPGLSVSTLTLPFLAVLNPYMGRIARGPEQSYMELLAEQNPSFFTCWLGNNDILFYAANGGDPNFPITPMDVFEANLATLLGNMKSKGAEGLVATIPDITSIPYFTTVSYTSIDQTDCDQGERAILIQQADNLIREATDDDFILLPAASLIGKSDSTGFVFGLHPENPVPKSLVLDSEEVKEVRNAIDGYNQIIQSLTKQYDFALADIYTFMKQAEKGIVLDGIEISGDFITGGAFSLDGIHITPRGNAIIANQFIQSINAHYEANIPIKNISDYEGVLFP